MRQALATATAASRVRPQKSDYGKPVPDLAAVTDHKTYNRVFDLLAAVVDHKDIPSPTHIEDSVEDSRTEDLAWLTQPITEDQVL